jgi:DNA-binding GntR family transcriptional regulator
MEELERERTRQNHGKVVRDPEKEHALESLRLARTELDRQLVATVNERRRAQIVQAIEEINRRMEETENGTSK